MNRVGGEGARWAGEGGHVRRHPRDSGPDAVERPRLAPSLALSGRDGVLIRETGHSKGIIPCLSANSKPNPLSYLGGNFA